MNIVIEGRSFWINYHHLYCFHVIAEEGSLTRAATRLGIGQSALSIQMKQFEQSLVVQKLRAELGMKKEKTESTININQDKESGLGLEENISLAVREQQENIDQQHKKTKVPPPRKGAGGVQELVLNALHKAIKEHGEMRLLDGKRNKSVHVEQWSAAFYATQMNKTKAKKDFDRCFQTLQNAKKVEVFDPHAWVIYSDDDQNDSDF
jgi:hypothetical protein